MSKVVLFSPVGGTDPISETNYRDGSMLHICRHYKPDVVFLYLSAEMVEKHKSDDRYRYFIKRLYEKFDKKIQIIPIEKVDLIDVSDHKFVYNFLLNDIQLVTDILEDGDTLLINVSSGSPAIKNNLQVLNAIGKFDKPNVKNIKTKLIQVKTPTKKMNTHLHNENIDKNDLETMWSLNEEVEGEVNYENRCFEDVSILLKVLQEVTIENLLRAYNYPAALDIAKGMKSLSEPYIKYIEGAVNRNKLDYNKAKNVFKDATNLKEIFPVKEGDKIKLFEYIQNVEIKYLRGEYADFIRSISPAVFELFMLILKKCSVDINKLSKKNSHGTLMWNKDTLIEEKGVLSILENSYDDFKTDSYVKSDHLQKIIDDLCSDEEIIEFSKLIRTIEEKVRNKAAHEIIKIDEKYIEKETNKTPKEICEILKKLFSYACKDLEKESWESYDRMNDYIIDKIK
jgi:hypothetical protein